MNVDRESKMSHSVFVESKEEKRNRFIKIFVEQKDWEGEYLLGFINYAFDNNVEDINWILKIAVESESWTCKIIDVLMKNGTELHVLNDLGQTAIHIAAMNKESTAIYRFLNYFGDENISDNEGFTYFHVACMYDFVELVQKFIDQGVDVNLTFYKEGRRISPLSLCLEQGTIDTLKLLLNNGADLKLYDDWNEEPLSCLKRIRFRDPMDRDEYKTWEIIANHHFKELLKQTTDSEITENRSDSEGFTYLHAACMSGSIEMVQKFIDQKDNLDLIWCLADGTKESPLTLATEFKRIEIVEMLLENGANPNIRLLGKNPLHIFFKYFVNEEVDSSLLDLLIRYNCDVNEKDNDGSSPLFLCFENCNEQYNSWEPQPWAGGRLRKAISDRKNLETLLKNKANINEVFENGQSILHLFIKSDICRTCWIDVGGCTVIDRNTVGIKLIKTLLKYGANVNAKDDNGDSPLHLAVMSNNLDVVELLLAHGADMQSFDFSKLHWFTSHLDFDWLDQMIRFFLILHCLNDKGYIMDELSCLTVLKFLVNEIDDCDLSIQWEHKIFVGSASTIRSLLTSVKNMSGGDELNEYKKKCLARQVHKQLQYVEKGHMFMTTKKKHYLQQLQQFFMLDEKDICRINAEIPIEIEKLKKLQIKNDVSLLDVCASSPGKAYYLMKNSKVWTVLDSENLSEECCDKNYTIRGYIVKCFMKKFFMDIGLKYILLLMQGKLSILSCKTLIKYLDYKDIMNLCEAYVNKN